MCPRTENIAIVAATMIAIQRSQAMAGRRKCSGIVVDVGSRRSKRRPIECVPLRDRSAPVTSADDGGAIPDARLRDDDPRRRRIVFDPSPEIRDVDAQILLGAAELPAPNGIEDLLMRERSSTGVHEREENLPLDGREVDLAAVALHASGYRI